MITIEFIGWDDVYGIDQCDGNLAAYSYDHVQINNFVCDEIKCDNDGTMSANTTKSEWGDVTEFLASFNGIMECGNISMDDSTIEKIRIYKKLVGSYEWTLIAELEYSEDIVDYVVEDRLAFSEEYCYAVVPVANGVEGAYATNTIKARFSNLWVVDRFGSVCLKYDTDYGTINHNQTSAVINPIGREYPIVQHISVNNYCSGTMSAKILKLDADGEINFTDRSYVKEVIDFLKDNNAKVIKDSSGRKMLVSLSNIKETPMQYSKGAVNTISFNYTEIGNVDSFDNLVENGLLPEDLGL